MAAFLEADEKKHHTVEGKNLETIYKQKQKIKQNLLTKSLFKDRKESWAIV